MILLSFVLNLFYYCYYHCACLCVYTFRGQKTVAVRPLLPQVLKVKLRSWASVANTFPIRPSCWTLFCFVLFFSLKEVDEHCPFVKGVTGSKCARSCYFNFREGFVVLFSPQKVRHLGPELVEYLPTIHQTLTLILNISSRCDSTCQQSQYLRSRDR